MIIKNNKQGNIWFIRIMSLIAACVLWDYVMNEQNPFISRTFSATVSTSNLPSSMVVNYLPETVKVRVSGPRSQISALNDASIQAYVDFRLCLGALLLFFCFQDRRGKKQCRYEQEIFLHLFFFLFFY